MEMDHLARLIERYQVLATMEDEIKQAFEIIKESAGTHLDAGLVDVFLSIKDEIIEAHNVIVAKSK